MSLVLTIVLFLLVLAIIIISFWFSFVFFAFSFFVRKRWIGEKFLIYLSFVIGFACLLAGSIFFIFLISLVL